MVDVLVWGSPFLILISYVARVAGDVYFAESDGSFTAGKKAVGLSRSSLPATPPNRVHRPLSTSTVALPSVSPRAPAVTVDRYGGRDWPHDAQPRDTQDLTPPPPSPSPDPNMVCDTQVDDSEGETHKGPSSSVSTKSVAKGEKFDKYYHQTFSSTYVIEKRVKHQSILNVHM